MGLRGAEDDAHLAFTLCQGRVVYTNDEDFLVLHDRKTEHAGIAYCWVLNPGSGHPAP